MQNICLKYCVFAYLCAQPLAECDSRANDIAAKELAECSVLVEHSLLVLL